MVVFLYWQCSLAPPGLWLTPNKHIEVISVSTAVWTLIWCQLLICDSNKDSVGSQHSTHFTDTKTVSILAFPLALLRVCLQVGFGLKNLTCQVDVSLNLSDKRSCFYCLCDLLGNCEYSKKKDFPKTLSHIYAENKSGSVWLHSQKLETEEKVADALVCFFFLLLLLHWSFLRQKNQPLNIFKKS